LTGRCKRAGQADHPLAKSFDRQRRACAAASDQRRHALHTYATRVSATSGA